MHSRGPVSTVLLSLMLLAGCTEQEAEPTRREVVVPHASVPKVSTDAPAAETDEPVGDTAVALVPAVAAATPPTSFAQCRSCHAVEPGQHGIGPSLHGIAGRQAAGAPGFNYSTALRQSGIVWDRAALERWLEAPMRLVPGTRMVLGVRNEQQRDEIIDYMESLR